MSQRLFVYGTLAPGRENEHVLAPLDGSWEPASVRGSLHPEGWGATRGYPGILLDEEGDEVRGFLFTSQELARHWERIDEFEGNAYRRVITRARTQDGTEVEAFVYALR